MSSNRKRLEWLDNELSEVERLANLGTETVRAELKLRGAMRRMATDRVFEKSSPSAEEHIALASLLLGRLIRLRGRHGEARAWLSRAGNMYAGLNSSGVVNNLDGALRCTEHLALIEKDASITRAAAGDALDLRISEQVVERLQGMLNGNALIRDHGDHVLEHLQRRAELLHLSVGAVNALEFLTEKNFSQLLTERPEHNQVLRLLYLSEVNAAAGNLDRAIQYVDAAAHLGIVARSSFLQIMLNERRLDIALRMGDGQAAMGFERAVLRLRSIESITERPPNKQLTK